MNPSLNTQEITLAPNDETDYATSTFVVPGANTAIMWRTPVPIPQASKIKERIPKLSNLQSRHPPPPAHVTSHHPGLATIKSVGPRGSYCHNTGDPWTNSSVNYRYLPVGKTQLQTKTNSPLNTQTLTPTPDILSILHHYQGHWS